jgi:hypothetical protein
MCNARTNEERAFRKLQHALDLWRRWPFHRSVRQAGDVVNLTARL